MPPVKKSYRPLERDKRYVDSPSQRACDLATALEATRQKLAEQRETLVRAQVIRRWRVVRIRIFWRSWEVRCCVLVTPETIRPASRLLGVKLAARLPGGRD